MGRRKPSPVKPKTVEQAEPAKAEEAVQAEEEASDVEAVEVAVEPEVEKPKEAAIPEEPKAVEQAEPAKAEEAVQAEKKASDTDADGESPNVVHVKLKAWVGPHKPGSVIEVSLQDYECLLSQDAVEEV